MKKLLRLFGDVGILLIVAVESVGGKAAYSAEHVAARLSPELEPRSDKKFFGKDYPVDKHAVVDKHYVFNHPYPAVQDSDDFDKDFVKDENGDGGMWEAHMRYDTLRAKIHKARERSSELQEKMEKERAEWQSAKAKAEEHEVTLERARTDVKVARGKAEAAAKRVNDLEGASQQDGTKTGGAMGRAIRDVEKEMEDLQDCQEVLAKAKARLKKLVEESEKAKKIRVKKEKEAAEKKAKAVKKAAEERKKRKQEAAEDKGEEEEEEAEKEEEEEDTETKDYAKVIDKDRTKAAKWRANYLKELEDAKQTEKQLNDAAVRLKKFRRSPFVDSDGGVYNEPSQKHRKSSATAISSSAVVLILALAIVGLGALGLSCRG